MRKVALIGVLLLGLFVAMMQDAMAQTPHPSGGRITIGRLTVVPGLNLTEEYDDNIYLTNGKNDTTEEKVSDWITHVGPNLLLNYTLDGRGKVTAGYLGDYAWYRDNTNNDWKSHTGLFNFDYQAPSGLIAGVNNTYVQTADPYGGQNQYKLGTQTKRWNDNLQSKMGYQFSDRFRFLGYYNYYKQDYKEEVDSTQNYDSNEIGLGSEIKVFPLTWAFLRYYYGELEYNKQSTTLFGVTDSNNADYNWHRANVGLTWDPEGKFKGELSFGYEWRQYDNTVSATGSQFGDESFWTAGTRISYSATSTTTLSLTILRTQRDSGSDTAENYIDTGGSIGIIQALDYRLNILATVGYSKNEYNLPANDPKSQDNYIGTVGLEYKLFDWLAAIGSYTYYRKDSNYEADEYTDNRVIFGLRALY